MILSTDTLLGLAGLTPFESSPEGDYLWYSVPVPLLFSALSYWLLDPSSVAILMKPLTRLLRTLRTPKV